MNQEEFGYRIQELIDENPFAVRAFLKVLQVEFTDAVPTLAVTREKNPRLLVNLDFVNRHCRSSQQVKALILHEFLHILLRHTEKHTELTPAMHLALDAVINAIIHRQMGDEYSSMMGQYYRKAKGFVKFLRPLNDNDYDEWGELEETSNFPYQVWESLYEGKLVADDICEIVETFEQSEETRIFMLERKLLGGHQELEDELPREIEDALNHALKSMNGVGIWRSPKSQGAGGDGYDAKISATEINLNQWKNSTMRVLQKYVISNQKGVMMNTGSAEFLLPVLSTSDRRAFIRTLWSPFIPDSSWKTEKRERSGQAQVYLDVSGSMHAEMPLLIHLLNKLRAYILSPFWAFSTEVAPAVIHNGQLVTRTTGGTSLACVLDHIVLTKPATAVIITDGYIEPITPQQVLQTRPTRLAAIISRDGSPNMLQQANIPYTKLERIPQ